MEIGGVQIGAGNPPYIIAEMSCNHGGKLEVAKKIIKLAKAANVSAIKTQCYEPQTITMDMRKPDFIVQDGLWKGRTLWELYKTAHTPFKWHPDLYKVAQDEGITIFSSVFDRSAVDFLEGLGCPAYKIASMEISDTVLIRHAAATGKPLIISTGMASIEEIREADEASNRKAAFLHCMSEYPGTVETSNLGGIYKLRDILSGNIVGISDHSTSNIIPIAATAIGASIIEAHFGMIPGVKSEDDEFSLSPTEFAQMVKEVNQTWNAMRYHANPRNPSRQFRRSLYANADIKKGDRFTEDNIRSVRPGYGLPCKMFPSLLGRKAGRDYRRGDPLS